MSSYFKEGELNTDGTPTQSSNPLTKLGIYWEVLNDRIKNYFVYRWVVVVFIFLVFILRLFITKGNHIQNRIYNLYYL